MRCGWVIQEVTERAHGQERWWRTVPVDLREPDYDSLSPAEQAALDEWRAGQIPGELALVSRFVRDVRKHGGWARASRASGYYTAGTWRRSSTMILNCWPGTGTAATTPRPGRG
jgi:hypothetical protein